MEKIEHRQEMLRYLRRDIEQATGSDVVVGFRVWPRMGTCCPRAEAFCGEFLPHEMPNLYPEDCPDEAACCCVERETVLRIDATWEAALLTARAGESQPASEIWDAPAMPAAQIPKEDRFAFDEARAIARLLKADGAAKWSRVVRQSYMDAADGEALVERLIARSWVTRSAKLDFVLVTDIGRRKMSQIDAHAAKACNLAEWNAAWREQRRRIVLGQAAAPNP